jgi:adenosylmethionine-8-amino-7-oxononanoate aminotransferase
VYDVFLGKHEEFKTFFHGHTYTGNPLACAAAIATLELFEREQTLERLQDRIALLDQLLRDLVAPLPHVREVRRMGFMCGIELGPYEPAERMGHRVTLEARARGAIVRPLGDVVVLMPPLSIADDELTRLVAITAEAIAAATGAGTPRAPAAVAPVSSSVGD